MVFGIYDPPRAEVSGWSELKIGDICDVLEFKYEKYFCGAGTFSLILPRNSVFADEVCVGRFLIKRSDGCEEEYDGFIIKNIVYENDTLKLTGYDLNGLLVDRVTLYPEGSTDKDIRSGSTEEIVKAYVDYNCVSSPDEERNFPKLGIAENKYRGISDDAASPRLECVADVVGDILGAQGMGYRITPRLNGSGPAGELMEFEVYEAVDRTQDQSENSRVTFAFGLGNVAQMKREVGVTADKNTFYCEIDSGAVQRYYKKGEDNEENDSEEEKTVSGYDRREEYLKLGCELGELEVYAEHEIADRYRLTDSLDITAGDPLDYGRIYNVGDIVTVYDRKRALRLDSVISAAEISRTDTEYSVKLTLGDSKPKLLDSYAKKGQATANVVRSTNVRDTLTEYEYLTDVSVKYNGKTYTVERDEETGLISKISDSSGGSFKPKINSGITDTALHNAVFWAVAMHSGISRAKQNYYDIVFEFNQTVSDPDKTLFYVTDEGHAAVYRLKSNYVVYAFLYKELMARGNMGLGMYIYDGAVLVKYVGDNPNVPQIARSVTSSSDMAYNIKGADIYIDPKPAQIHPAFSSRVVIGKKSHISFDKIPLKEIFDLKDTSMTDMMVYKFGANVYIEAYYDGVTPIVDNSNHRLDTGGNAKSVNITSNLFTSSGWMVQPNTGTQCWTSRYAIQLTGSAQYRTSAFEGFIADLSGSVFFNTFNLCDESGNILLKKNCDLDFFI